MAATPKMSAQDKEYMAESDLRTMVEAEKIKRDKPRMAAAMKKHKDMMAAMENIGDKKHDG